MDKDNKDKLEDMGIEVISKDKNVKKDKSILNVLLILIIAIIFGIVFFNYWFTNYIDNDFVFNESVSFNNTNPNNLTYEQMNCLSLQYKFYGTNWCSHCKEQKEILGTKLTNITFVDCDENKLLCKNLGVKGYPMAIIFNSNNSNEMSRIYGVQSMDKIINETGCFR